MDTFTEAKQSVVRSVSLLYQDMDSDFYQKLSADVQEQLSQAKDQLETSGQTARTRGSPISASTARVIRNILKG